MIALLIVVTLAAIFGLIARRYEEDSRERGPSQEERFAAHGMRWPDPRDERLARELADELRLARQRRLTRPLAGETHTLACSDHLSPERDRPTVVPTVA